jgi:hypothetical protein
LPDCLEQDRPSSAGELTLKDRSKRGFDAGREDVTLSGSPAGIANGPADRPSVSVDFSRRYTVGDAADHIQGPLANVQVPLDRPLVASQDVKIHSRNWCGRPTLV